MAPAAVPEKIEEFLAAKRIAVAGVSRSSRQPANAILRRLRETGHDVVALNPRASVVEGEKCYPSLATVPGQVDALMIVTHPSVSADLVKQAADCGIRHVWFHRSYGEGSVSPEALVACAARGIEPIIGGCPMMYAGRVDIVHRCFRWWIERNADD